MSASLESQGAAQSVRSFAVPAWVFVLAFIIGGTAFHIGLHYQVHHTFNVNHVVVVFFLLVNLLVNFWEIGLLVCADDIRDEYEATKDAYRGREAERFAHVFRKRIPVTRLLSFREWAGIWSTYALVDPGYASRSSFAFNIDVGNGWSTPIFATIFVFGMTFELMPARVLGIIGVVMFWQMFYGTVIYFFQFFHLGRHKGHSVRSIALLVGGTNSPWFTLSLWGLALSVWMILNDSYSVFL